MRDSSAWTGQLLGEGEERVGRYMCVVLLEELDQSEIVFVCYDMRFGELVEGGHVCG